MRAGAAPGAAPGTGGGGLRRDFTVLHRPLCRRAWASKDGFRPSPSSVSRLVLPRTAFVVTGKVFKSLSNPSKCKDCGGAIYKNLSREPAAGRLQPQGTRHATMYGKVIAVCGYKGCSKPATKTCAACKEQGYCSKLCQVQDWTSHKTRCKESKKRVAAASEPCKVACAASARRFCLQTCALPLPLTGARWAAACGAGGVCTCTWTLHASNTELMQPDVKIEAEPVKPQANKMDENEYFLASAKASLRPPKIVAGKHDANKSILTSIAKTAMPTGQILDVSNVVDKPEEYNLLPFRSKALASSTHQQKTAAGSGSVPRTVFGDLSPNHA